jgi:hypothetical protein
VLWITFWLAGVPRLRVVAVPGGLVFMSEKIVSICENESLRSATVKAVDALDREIDAVWGLIAIIEVLDRESRDNQALRTLLIIT